ncbi:MAG: tetratricopeptide repeat protein [Methanothrix sp.]|nr:MAG: tetratricopeptide repeat protein [Methanothrix sp.]
MHQFVISVPSPAGRALQLLASGHLDEARIYLEELLRQDPDNPDLLYNLGLCYVDLGQLEKGMELLHRCLQFAPGHSHAYVALGIAYQKKGDLPRAKEYAMRALAADPKNPVALKNLGAILGKEGDGLRALYYLRPFQRVRSPGSADRVRPCLRLLTGDIEPAEKHFRQVLKLGIAGKIMVYYFLTRLNKIFIISVFYPRRVSGKYLWYLLSFLPRIARLALHNLEYLLSG